MHARLVRQHVEGHERTHANGREDLTGRGIAFVIRPVSETLGDRAPWPDDGVGAGFIAPVEDADAALADVTTAPNASAMAPVPRLLTNCLRDADPIKGSKSDLLMSSILL